VSLEFNDGAISILESSMMLVSISLIVPSATSATLSQSESGEDFNAHDMLTLSRGTAIILIITLAIYLYFRLKSHASFLMRGSNTRNTANGDNSGGTTLEAAPTLGPAVAACIFVAAILSAISCSYYLVDSIDRFATSLHIPKTFVNFILIPFAGNAGRYTSAIAMGRRNRTDLAVKAVISSILNITLLVIPSVVLLGWIIDQPMALDFAAFEATVFTLAILVVNSVLQVGKASYFQGVMLVGM
jgi:Ca2+:H+ antiporter